MEINNRKKQLILIISLILIAVVSRLLPHLPNFTPVAAIALFGGTFIQRKSLAFLIPMLAMLVSDIIIGLHITMISVYVSMAITVLLGFRLQKNTGMSSIISYGLISSVLFFVITNFSVWMTGMVGYPMNVSGLFECYTAALPFFRWELFGNMVYISLLFGIYSLVKNRTRLIA